MSGRGWGPGDCRQAEAVQLGGQQSNHKGLGMRFCSQTCLCKMP